MTTQTHITCPHVGCDATISRGANFCARCGRSLVPVRLPSRKRSQQGGLDLVWFGLSLASFLIGITLMRMGVCFGFVFIGLPVASIFCGRNKAGSAH